MSWFAGGAAPICSREEDGDPRQTAFSSDFDLLWRVQRGNKVDWLTEWEIKTRYFVNRRRVNGLLVYALTVGDDHQRGVGAGDQVCRSLTSSDGCISPVISCLGPLLSFPLSLSFNIPLKMITIMANRTETAHLPFPLKPEVV